MAIDAETAAVDVVRKVQRALGKGSQAAALAPLLYSRDGLNGLDGMPAEWLAANVREALEFIATKPRRRHKIRIRRVAATGKKDVPESSVIEILNDDMPFLVDSVLGELQARSLTVRHLLHPIFKTERDKDGRLQAITGAGDVNWSDGHQESYIAIHLRSMPETEARALTATISDILGEVRVAVADWRAMLQRVAEGRRQLEHAHIAIPPEARGEACRIPAVARAGQLHVPRCARVRAYRRPRHRRSGLGRRSPASAFCATRMSRCCAAAANLWR